MKEENESDFETNSNSLIVKNLFWRMGERYSVQIVQFIVQIVLARFLEPSLFGTIALIIVFINILQVFVDSGLGNSLIQKKDADDLDFSTVFFFNIFLCLILYSLIFCIAPFISNFFESDLTSVIRVLSLVIVISGIKNVQQAYVSRNMLFKKFFIATSIGTLISAIISIIMAYKGYGVWAIVAQNIINNLIDTLLLWIIIKWKPKLQFSFTRLKKLLQFGWKLLVSAIINVSYNEMRQLIIGKRYSNEDLAFYNRGEQFPKFIVNSINSSIDSVLFPSLSKLQNDKVKVREMTRKAIKTSFYIMAPMMIGLAVCANSIVKLVLTDKWLECVPFMQILCIEYVFYPIHTANLNAIQAMGRSDYFLILEIIKKVVGVIVLLISMWYGPIWIAFSLVITTFISQIINSWPNKKLLDYSYFKQIKDIIPTLLIALIMGGIVYAVGLLNINYVLLLVLQVATGIISYIVLSLIFKNDSFLYIISLLKKIKTRKVFK